MGAAEEIYADLADTKIIESLEPPKEKGRRGRKNTSVKRLAARRNIESYQEERALSKNMEEFWFDDL
ncbi:PA3496 family putative envelope integrity protein [Litoribacillus peritrichatus]|uniref:Uncharacterized protein n=1 Tax=Litoribacillus peritrichatus TaxID=718191 RepID=A0ABP7N7K5_9GAMM